MTKAVSILAALAAMTASAEARAQDGNRHITINHAQGTAGLPFSDAVLAGSTLYLGGQLGVDPATGKIATDPTAEIKLIFTRLQAALRSADMTMDDLVSVQVYCTDMKQYELFNDLYKSNFSGPLPARVMIGISQLGLGAHFEVSGIAVRGNGRTSTRR